MLRRNVLYTCLIIIVLSLPFVLDYLGKKESKKADEIEFWQYWSGPEKKPLEKLVNQFNQENHGFTVKLRSISLPRKKILMAITAGIPPDLVHLDGDMVNDFALRNALLTIDFSELKINKSKFYENYLNILKVKQRQMALPFMPTAEALHINKTLLNKYDLKEPENLENLIAISEKIMTKSNYEEFGLLPTWPIWTGRIIVYLFGGSWAQELENGDYQITANAPENIKAWKWLVENFIKKIPKNKLQGFIEGNIAYQSPDNPFYSGKVALETNGIWEYGFVKKFSPQFDISVKALNATELTVDALAIPRGARDYDKSLYFMSWLLKEENISYLAKEQHKFPTIKLTPEKRKVFLKNHKHPYINVFIDLAESENAYYFPHLSFSKEYKREITKAFNSVLRLETSPEKALFDLQVKMMDVFDRVKR